MGLVSTTIPYKQNQTTLHGHIAYDDSQNNRPGVILVHEWWGLNGYLIDRAEQLASLGYTALAIDMYGDGITADNPNDANTLMNNILDDMETGTARLKAGLSALTSHSGTDASNIAAIGYCFGGAMVLHMARIGMPLKAVVSFHGSLGSFFKPKMGEVKAKILVCHGGADKFIPEEDIENFHSEMRDAGADYEFITYEGALHGFTSREANTNGKKYDLPLAYDETADHQSWQAMLKLFSESFS